MVPVETRSIQGVYRAVWTGRQEDAISLGRLEDAVTPGIIAHIEQQRLGTNRVSLESSSCDNSSSRRAVYITVPASFRLRALVSMFTFPL